MALIERRRGVSILRAEPHERLAAFRPDVHTVHQQRCRSRRACLLISVLALWITGTGTLQTVCQTGAQEPAGEDPQKSTEETSDGVKLAIWYYPAGTEEPLATVLLLHDLEGSHQSLEPLARSLQTAGCSVVSPDLRGHGESLSQTLPNGRTKELSAARLNTLDLEAIAASGGGPIREDAKVHGDIETTLQWIRKTARSDPRLDPGRLCVVGSGCGATLASLWTAADAAWKELTTGPQGELVRGLALISPDYKVKGASLVGALKSPVLARKTPLVILAGESDGDVQRFFDQLKRARPDGWFELGPDGKSSQADKVKDPRKEASVFLFRYATKDSGDALATAGVATFAPLLVDFFRQQLSR